MPAAVINIGKNFPRAAAPSNTALYPATVLMEDNTSMDWARVIRGRKSRLNDVTLPCASLDTASRCCRGCSNPTNTAPSPSDSASWRPPLSPGMWILRRTSTSPHIDPESPTTSAPASEYAPSGNPARIPAPCSTLTVKPARTSRFAMSGTSATRRSPSKLSLGMPIFTRNGPLFLSSEHGSVQSRSRLARKTSVR